MKTGFAIVVLTVGLLAGGMAGASQVGDIGNADTERALGWTSQIQGPIETGALPEAMGAASMDRPASGDRSETFVEVGGVRYRVGLDSGP